MTFRMPALVHGIHWPEVEINSTTLVVLVSLSFLSIPVSRFLKASQTPSYFPKVYTSFQPFALPGLLFPTTYWSTGFDWHWVRRFQTYTQNNETVNLVPLLSGTPGLWTTNMDIGRQIAAGGPRSSFIKPIWSSRVFLTWGMNLAASDGPVWRKHRRIVGPAFGTELYKLVWKKTIEVYRDMVEVEGWEAKDVVDIPVIQKITLKLAFLLISTCGFGFASTWDTPPQAAEGGMSIQETLKLVAESNLLELTFPRWLFYLPIPRLRAARVARERLGEFMHAQVVERKALVAAGDTRADAFTMLVKANQDESSKFQLDDDELIGNIFLLMFAGHETTSHTLAVTLGFLAIHPEMQNEVLEQILSVVGPDRVPEFDDYSKLDRVLAAFYEASRMFPAGHALVREASEDTVLTFPSPVGEEGYTTIPIPKGTQVMLDMVGAQYNPRYFEDPKTYKPSRWYGLPTDSELFTAFSVGPRTCIGRRFATVEATCFLTLLLRDWQVLPILRDGETREAWGARMMDAHIVLTLGVKDLPLRFVKRKTK